MDALEWALKGVSLRPVLNSIDSDGVRQGYDLELNRTVSERVEVPVIASGGAGTREHFLDSSHPGEGRCSPGRIRVSLWGYPDTGAEGLAQGQ